MTCVAPLRYLTIEDGSQVRERESDADTQRHSRHLVLGWIVIVTVMSEGIIPA
jgi:hypothetical protein